MDNGSIRFLDLTEGATVRADAIEAAELKNAGTKLDPDYFILISLQSGHQIQITKPPKGLGWKAYHAAILDAWRKAIS